MFSNRIRNSWSSHMSEAGSCNSSANSEKCCEFFACEGFRGGRSTPLAMKNGDCYAKTMVDMAPAVPSVQKRFVESTKHVLFGITNVMLVFIPLVLLSNCFRIGSSWIFLLSLVGIVPLAERLGFITEQLAYVTSPTVGGLLNATFGNATELIICVFALRNDMVRVVQLSLLGSVLSKMLPVLGFAFLCGGFATSKKEQKFDKDVEIAEIPEAEESQVDAWSALFWLAVLTIFISILSENIVDAIEGASEAWNIPVEFISVIILPIVGNAAEHTSAIIFAMKDNLNLSFAVAIGSSTQISMLVIPVCILLRWPRGASMDLNFELFETAVLFISVLVVAFMLLEGTGNYFEGVMLVLCYFIVGTSFFVHVDPPIEVKVVKSLRDTAPRGQLRQKLVFLFKICHVSSLDWPTP